MKTAKCFFCGKIVKVNHSGNISSHLNGAIKCVGIGQSAKKSEMWRDEPWDGKIERVALAEKYKRGKS